MAILDTPNVEVPAVVSKTIWDAEVVPEELEFLEREGYAVIKEVLDPAVCDALRSHVWAMTDEASRVGRNDLFGNIQNAEQRWDLKLDLCEPVVDALNQYVGRVGPLLANFLGGQSAKIVELASITSGPGAIHQGVHADTMHGITRFLQSDIELPTAPIPTADLSDDEEDVANDVGSIVKAVATETAIITSALIALQDIHADMGPTHVWPSTNTVEHHASLWATAIGGKLSVEEADEIFKVQHKKMTIKKGDVLLYDSRTMHCGGSNTSVDKRRSVLVVSTMGPGLRPDGSTYTLIKDLRNKLWLNDFPLAPERVQAPTAAVGSVILPDPPAIGASTEGDADPAEGRPLPALESWEAAVQCNLCRKWRPVCAADAAKYAGADNGFFCKTVGFVCSQPQKYSNDEVDAAME